VIADRLLIFAEPPYTSATRRLSPPLTQAAAAALCTACLRDVVARAARERGRVEIWYGGAGPGERYFHQQFGHITQHPQREGAPGERLADAFARSFDEDAERVVVIAGLAATVPDGRLTAAFEDLIEADVVLGPGTDGSPYLFGLHRRAWPRASLLFGEETWTPGGGLDAIHVQTVRTGLELRLLPGWYEVAGADELERARQDALPESHVAGWLRDRGAGG
jgi:glycosyltransferase A (GT-A) superfamily protein (DUF2064 family)